MCNCINDTADRLKGRVTESDMNPPKGATVESVNTSNMALMFKSGTFELQIPFTISWKGTTARGHQIKDTKVYVNASFCPFCGESFKTK